MLGGNIESAKNPVWTSAEQVSVNLTIRVKGIDEDLPFHATPNDVVDYGRDLYAKAIAGEFGEIAPWVPPPTELVAQRAREQRDLLLAASDWTQMPDVPQTVKDLWVPYRQALRDVPQQAGFPNNIVWPTSPQ